MIVDHLYRLEKTTEEEKEIEISENFPDEILLLLSVQVPWYANIANYLACGIMPPKFSYQQKINLGTDN